MRELLTVDLDGGRVARIVHSTRADGDLSPSTVQPETLAHRRARMTGTRAWHAPRQVHGCDVVVITADEPVAGTASAPKRAVADAVVTTEDDQVIAVHTGDCVPVGLVHPGGAAAVAHAGWKGLEAGVLARTVEAIRHTQPADDRPIVGVIGPHIRASSYEFGDDDLDRLVDLFGGHVRSRTGSGTPALDLTAATLGALEVEGVEVRMISPDCTAEGAAHYWSHRARGEAGRIALAAWLEPA